MSTAPTVALDDAAERAMSLLAGGIPLSLLLDLACGPRSEELLSDERVPEPQDAA